MSIRFYYQRPVASKFTGPKTLDYHVLSDNVGGTVVELEQNLQMMWDSLFRTDRQSCKGVLEVTMACIEAKDGH